MMENANLVSLNGIPQAEAIDLITGFRTTVYKKKPPRAKVSVWFSRDEIVAMHDLLAKLTEPKADGFRIYFIQHDNAPQYEFSLMLVATKAVSIDPNTTKHVNFYHDATGVTRIEGKREVGDCNGGALLYKPCIDTATCVDDAVSISVKHWVSRKNCELMVANFGNAGINTRSVWFDYDLLKSLATHDSLKKISGIRIYYGNYGKYEYKSDKAQKVEDKRAERDTVILVPTSNIADPNVHVDLFTKLDKIKHDKSIKSFDNYNVGELCPAHCNDDEPPTP